MTYYIEKRRKRATTEETEVMEMFENLGTRKYALPIAFVIAVACVMALVFYPMAHMEPKNLPFAVLSLDKGVETPQGNMNAGKALIENLTSAETQNGENTLIAWEQVESQEELDKALEDGEYYGAIIVPENFTADQMTAKQAETQAMIEQAQALLAAQQAAIQPAAQGAAAEAADTQAATDTAGTDDAASALAATAADKISETPEAPSLKVVLDNAKSPLVASMMQSSISQMFSRMGVNIEVETVHAGETADSVDSATMIAANPMGTMMAQQIAIMPLLIMSVACGILITRIVCMRGKPAERLKALGMQAALAAAFSLVAALAVYCVALWAGGTELPFAETTAFLWLAGFCLMLAFAALADVALPLAALGALCALCGMACGVMPVEMLPAFWQDWIYPWVPQHFIGEGMRAIMYLGAGALNDASLPLAITGIAGSAIGCLAAFIPRKAR